MVDPNPAETTAPATRKGRVAPRCPRRVRPLRRQPSHQRRGARARGEAPPLKAHRTGVQGRGVEREGHGAARLREIRSPDMRRTQDNRRGPGPFAIQLGQKVERETRHDPGRGSEDGLGGGRSRELTRRLAASRTGPGCLRNRWHGHRRWWWHRSWLGRLGRRSGGRRNGRLAFSDRLPFVRRADGHLCPQVWIERHRDDQCDTVGRLGTRSRLEPPRGLLEVGARQHKIGDDGSRVRRMDVDLRGDRRGVDHLDAGRARRDTPREVCSRGAVTGRAELETDLGRSRLGSGARHRLQEERDHQGGARCHRADGSIPA